ncbi:hypothetical protein M9H77_24057 [Catharanthus roseus]|uniref:Uncharacterized protein n=1 Tax=Catharanthus roseus TaxID=4058 RepID=A0ACC0AV08_CATRO|nr:hypothetical protein M9H77_24057 [Catharanthus roseus]
MPQVDLEILVSACGGGSIDRKITCETLADGGAAAEEEGLPQPETKDDRDVPPVEVDVPLDFPPESFWLSKDAEFDWFDRNAFFERKESTKGISISTTNLNPTPNSNSNSNSQRFSLNLKSKTSILGLPKTQKTNYIDCKRRPANVQLFPKRSQSVGGKSTVGMAEPSSPKVSCMGRVRSKRGRGRSTEHSRKKERSVVRSSSDDHEKRRKGLYSRVMSMFAGRRRDKRTGRSRTEKREVQAESTVAEEAPRKSAPLRLRELPTGIEPDVEPPVLGGIKKFASGRRSESWSTDDFDVVLSESLTNGPTKRS